MDSKIFLMTLITASAWAAEGNAQQLEYPATRKQEHVDEYHGVKVSDPYRWLEDDRSEETAAWVKAQNEVTFGYLRAIPFREKIFQDLEKAYNYPKYSAPKKKGDYFYFYKNDGLQNQAVLYRQKGLNGTPEVVIDPNKLSPDGTTRLTVFSLSKDGAYAVFGFSKGGSDWQEYQVMNMKDLSMLGDKVEWVKVSGASWQGDGFYYSRYPKPDGSALAAKNENHQVYFHRVGTKQEQDKLVFEDPANPQRFHTVGTTEDEQYAVLSVSDRGKGKDGNGVWVLKKGESRFIPIREEITDASFRVIENVGADFLIETNDGAPNGKVVLFKTADKTWESVLPERKEPLE